MAAGKFLTNIFLTFIKQAPELVENLCKHLFKDIFF